MTKYKWSQTAANNANADSTIDYSEGQAGRTLNNSARAAMAAAAKERDDLSGVGPSNAVLETAGTSTAYTIDSNQVLDALTNGFSLTFRVHTACGSAPTLNVDSTGAKKLRWKSEVDASANDFLTGYEYTATYYQPTDEWLARAGGAVPAAADSINGSKIADDSIDSEHYVDGSIDTAHLADDAVTFDKIQNINTARLLGRTTASSGSVEEIQAGPGLTLSGGSLSLSSLPGLVFIETQTASSSSFLAFTSLGTYSSFLFMLDDLRPDTNDVVMYMQVRPTSGSFQTSGYAGIGLAFNASAAAAFSSTTGIQLCLGASAVANTANYGLHGHIFFKSAGVGRHGVTGQTTYRQADGNPGSATIAGYFDTNGSIEAVRFLFQGAAVITSGSIRCYGMR